MRAEYEVESGTIFASDFRVDRQLGHGGMGAVYVAHQLSTGRDRALKLMHPMLVRDEALRRRFELEAKIGSRIKSEHVVQVIASGVDGATGVPWLVMELLEGDDLGSYVAKKGNLSLAEVAPIVAELGHALGAAHAVGVVHRDLKPENVFLAHSHREGLAVTVKLLDLGIAKIVADANANASQTGAVGTPLWMSPEQTAGRVTAAADVWALGLLVFWMLTGRYYWRSANGPEGSTSVIAVLREIAVEPLEPASVRAVELGFTKLLPAGFDAWFARCVAREPVDRFPDAEQARTAFRSLLAGVADTAPLDATLLASLSRSSGSGTSDARASEPRAVVTAPRGSGTSAPFAATQSASQSGAVAPPARGRVIAALTVLGVVAVALIAIGRSGSPGAQRDAPIAAASATLSAASSLGTTAQPAPAAAPAASASAGAPLAPIDQADAQTAWRVPLGTSPRRGPDDALVTIVEFGNFQCPLSKGAERAVRQLLDEYGAQVRLVWKDDPLAIHNQADAAATLAREARAAKGDDGFWVAHDAMIEKSFIPTMPNLLALAKRLGLDADQVAEAIGKSRYANGISSDVDLTDDFGVLGTPYFFVNGRRALPTMMLDKVRALVIDEIAHAEKLVAKGVPKTAIYDHILDGANPGQPLEIKKIAFGADSHPGRGAEQPSVFIYEFCDFSNLLCRLLDPTVDHLIAEYTGKLGAFWIDLPEKKDADARRAAIVMNAAYYKSPPSLDSIRHKLLDAGQYEGTFNESAIGALAGKVGLTRQELKRAFDDPAEHERLDRLRTAAEAAGITRVPSFLVCGSDLCSTGGYSLSGGVPMRAFEKRINLALAAKGGKLPTYAR